MTGHESKWHRCRGWCHNTEIQPFRGYLWFSSQVWWIPFSLTLFPFFFIVEFLLFSWLSSSIFYGYFGCMALCVSPVDDARDWLLDAVGIWSQVCKKKSKLNGFWCDYCFIGMIAWHWGMGYERMVNIWFSDSFDPIGSFNQKHL